jgi:hypothetical protein
MVGDGLEEAYCRSMQIMRCEDISDRMSAMLPFHIKVALKRFATTRVKLLHLGVQRWPVKMKTQLLLLCIH